MAPLRDDNLPGLRERLSNEACADGPIEAISATLRALGIRARPLQDAGAAGARVRRWRGKTAGLLYEINCPRRLNWEASVAHSAAPLLDRSHESISAVRKLMQVTTS